MEPKLWSKSEPEINRFRLSNTGLILVFCVAKNVAQILINVSDSKVHYMKSLFY